MFYIYMIECVNGAFYTGYTTDIKRRYLEHCSRSYKCKYTRSFLPKKLAACWEISSDLSSVLKVEKFIKQLPLKIKRQIVDSPCMLWEILTENILDTVEMSVLTKFAAKLA